MPTTPVDPRQSIINTQEFLALSSFLNYQLSGEPVNWQGILNLMLDKHVELVEDPFLMEALEFLGDAYGQQKRRLGPLAVLHPIRAASLYIRAMEDPDILNILTTLLHDRNEDITPDRYDPNTWQRLDRNFRSFLEKTDAETNWYLNERIAFLTKAPGQKYFEYLGQLLEHARTTPELAAIKLADRLDNSLDLRVDLQDVADETHCYQVLFDMLFVNSYKGFKVRGAHPIRRKINGAMRLYQLYKNAVFLSLLRFLQIPLDKGGKRLFFSLALAGIREAQTILLHIFAYHLNDPERQRRLLMEVMEYAQMGGLGYINVAGSHRLDGLLKTYFEFQSHEQKRAALSALYEDTELMGQAALAFIVVFANFVNDEHFTIRGISPGGIIPEG